ncbi:MAG: ABC transporter ATP-binding protein, partial [Firmicutes bacterium]|nr:ABC transporter ATP-binding protein [Bacillota bacterium]
MIIKKFLKKYGWLYIPGVLFLALCSRITTLAPKALGDAIDLLEQAVPDKNLVWKQAGIIILIAVAIFVTRFIWRMMIIRNARSMECFLREELFTKLQNLPISFFAKRRSGDLLAYAINDVGAVRMTFGPVLAQGLNGIITGTISIWQMSQEVSGRLTILALIPIPIAVVSNIIIGKLVQKRFRRVQELFSHLSGFVNESIMGSRVVKTFAREKEWQDEFEHTSSEMMRANVKLTDTSALLNPITVITFGISYAISLIYGGNLVMDGTIALGDLVAFQGYLLLIQQPVVALGRIVNMIHRGLASYKRLNEIFSAEGVPDEEMRDYERTIKGSLEARNLTFTYPDAEKPALDNITFKLKAGGTLGIAGKTGSGKSTLIGLILKFFDAPRGSLFIDGVDINDIPAKAIREASGYVPQDGFLFSTTIEKDIAFYTPGATLEDVKGAADLANIDTDIENFPGGYDTEVGERGTRLSGGQKQRISLARAL